MLQQPQYLTYKTQNIPFIILISHLMYKKNFLLYVLSWIQEIFDCGFEIMEAYACILRCLAAVSFS